MRIEKYKYLGSGRYRVSIEKEEYIIYEDIILKYNLLSKEEITKKELDEYLDNNSFYDAYYKAIKYINVKLRCEKEINTYLKKQNYNKKVIEKVIDKLIKDNYLNEDFYIKSYINDQINLKNVGPLKIKNDLIKLDLNETLIINNLEVFTKKLQKEKIEKLIDKEIRLNNNKSSFMLKQKILNSLKEKGFYLEDITEVLENTSIDDKDIYEKEYKKIYDKLSKKYSGNELEYKIKEKMYQKGFRGD